MQKAREEEAESKAKLLALKEEIERDRAHIDERMKLMKQKAMELFEASGG